MMTSTAASSMMNASLSVLVGLLVGLQCVSVNVEARHVNNEPVVGVLAQESPSRYLHYGDEYINANYVKYLEMAGAKVVGIKGGQSEDYYDEMFSQINGLLLPGGALDVNTGTSNYANSSLYFFQKALEANDKGDYFPLWGTCLGFEMLTVMAASSHILSRTDSENLTMPLTLVPNFRSSRLLGKAPDDIIRYLTKEPVAANAHHYSLTDKTYEATKSLNKFYRVISVNDDRKGVQFVSTFEAYDYPFYGVQWHPEKSIFSWIRNQAVDHSAHAIQVAHYMANFFLGEARKNFHKFKTMEAESKTIVENDLFIYDPETFGQTYFYNITS